MKKDFENTQSVMKLSVKEELAKTAHKNEAIAGATVDGKPYTSGGDDKEDKIGLQPSGTPETRYLSTQAVRAESVLGFLNDNRAFNAQKRHVMESMIKNLPRNTFNFPPSLYSLRKFRAHVSEIID